MQNERMLTVNHRTMITPYDLKLKKNEVQIIDDYVLSNNLQEMNLETFCNVVNITLPAWRCEQLVSKLHTTDNGQNAYIQYLNFSDTKSEV
jgi:hypothetical protein